MTIKGIAKEEIISAQKFLKSIGELQNRIVELPYIVESDLPDQKESDVYNAVDKCIELGILPKVNEFTPIPGTEQFKDLVNKGLLEENTDPLLFDNSILPYWWNHGFSAKTIQDMKDYSNKKRRIYLDAK